MGMMGSADGDPTNLNNAVADILKSQNITDIKNVNCAKVTDDQLEKLGDGWMDARLGEGQAHENMDNMMGGEGSQTLTSMHEQMGRNYLGCSGSFQNSNSNWGGMMNGSYGYNGMMGNYYMGYGTTPLLTDLVMLAALIFLVTGSIFFIRGIKK